MKSFVLYLIYIVFANANPIKTVQKDLNTSEITNGNITGHTDIKTAKNDSVGESRAGIIDNINPFRKETEQLESNKNNDDGQNNPLGGIQNLFNNVPQFFNGSNPIQQLFSSQSGGNFLDNVKVFVVGTQGMVMPASAMLGGFQNIMQALGNMGNLLQVPSLPSGQ